MIELNNETAIETLFLETYKRVEKKEPIDQDLKDLKETIIPCFTKTLDQLNWALVSKE